MIENVKQPQVIQIMLFILYATTHFACIISTHFVRSSSIWQFSCHVISGINGDPLYHHCFPIRYH